MSPKGSFLVGKHQAHHGWISVAADTNDETKSSMFLVRQTRKQEIWNGQNLIVEPKNGTIPTSSGGLSPLWDARVWSQRLMHIFHAAAVRFCSCWIPWKTFHLWRIASGKLQRTSRKILWNPGPPSRDDGKLTREQKFPPHSYGRLVVCPELVVF